MSTITIAELKKIFPSTSTDILATYIEPFEATFEKYDISTVARKAAFIAQVGHESGNLTATKENLNYSQPSLRKVFGKYFPTDALAASYARKPERIANRVYANRMGNGSEESGDGWRFRGRGAIQITGRNNYTALAKHLGKTIDETVAFLETPMGAIYSAGWFWDTNGLNAYADQTRFTDMTKRINGGVNGLEHRKELWALARSVLK